MVSSHYRPRSGCVRRCCVALARTSPEDPAMLVLAEGLYANRWRVRAGDIDDRPVSFFEAAIDRRAAIEGGEVD